MNTTVHSQAQHKARAAALFSFAAVTGFVVAAIVMLNLHIMVGLEEGYAASPAEVWSWSPLLSALDVALLVGGPLLGIAAVSRVLRRERRAERR